mmetsp:Transcript_3962/g.4758  ORF Transcript_3962/g.4758 Transcript_3962/m.4758 type:complete len:268 (+) Transcript_3962:1704-2507(+)
MPRSKRRTINRSSKRSNSSNCSTTSAYQSSKNSRGIAYGRTTAALPTKILLSRTEASHRPNSRGRPPTLVALTSCSLARQPPTLSTPNHKWLWMRLCSALSLSSRRIVYLASTRCSSRISKISTRGRPHHSTCNDHLIFRPRPSNTSCLLAERNSSRVVGAHPARVCRHRSGPRRNHSRFSLLVYCIRSNRLFKEVAMIRREACSHHRCHLKVSAVIASVSLPRPHKVAGALRTAVSPNRQQVSSSATNSSMARSPRRRRLRPSHQP